MAIRDVQSSLIRVLIVSSTDGYEWELYVRYSVHAPWTYLHGDKSLSSDGARKRGLKAAEDWVSHLNQSSIKIDILTE